VGCERCEQCELLVTVSCYPLNARSNSTSQGVCAKCYSRTSWWYPHALVRLEAIPISLLVTCSPDLTQGSVHYYSSALRRIFQPHAVVTSIISIMARLSWMRGKIIPIDRLSFTTVIYLDRIICLCLVFLPFATCHR
jgi:hypothetical protein